MNSISKYISDVPSERVAFITKDRSFKYKDIFNLYASNKELIDNLSTSCVVIKARSRYEFAKLLSILDGNVKRIVFLPEDIEINLIEKYYKESNANFEVYLEDEILKVKEIDTNVCLENINDTQWVIPSTKTTTRINRTK